MNRRRLLQALNAGDELPAELLSSLNFPTVPTAVADYVEAKMSYGGLIKQVKLTLSSLPVTITDDAGVGGWGTAKLLDFPAGRVSILGGVCKITSLVEASAGINGDFDGDFAVGTTAVAAGTGAGTGVPTGTGSNIFASTAITQAVSGTSAGGSVIFKPAAEGTTVTDTTGATPTTTILTIAGTATYNSADINRLAAGLAGVAANQNKVLAQILGTRVLTLDGTGTAIDAILNVLIDDADQDGGGSLAISGTMTLAFLDHGDI